MEDRVADEGVVLSIATCRSAVWAWSITSKFVAAVCNSNSKLDTRDVKKLNGNQSEDGDAKTARRGDKRFGDTASHCLHRQLFVSEKAERTDQPSDRAQQTEQRRESHKRIHDHQESSGAFDLDACGNLQRGLERAVLMVQTIPKHS